MLRQTATILLLLAFLGQAFNRTFIVLDFYANRDFIAKNLCENRNKPKMNCCGKCQLNKRLKQEDNKDQQNPERKTDTRFEIAFRSSFAELPATDAVLIQPVHSTAYTANCSEGAVPACFHPPCA